MEIDKKYTIDFNQLSAYQLEYQEELKDTKSLGFVFRHKKSGARVCVISNDDNNKVFSIAFRTPPKDSTGVAHIIEHTVLCGSKNFPAKDPFIELAKGSLNTFLNAMTYSDKTMYPIASCNDKDFQNLMHVYMDAVFYPNIYNKREIFEQEGWHYELESRDDELTYNGIVYSEMKGAFSSPEQQLYREIQSSLYPDTAYGVESGGDPDYIPDLTYEDYLDFHRKYYHPSNSYIYLYGDVDVVEKLTWLDEAYLREYDTLQVDSKIQTQEAFGCKEIESFYSLSDSDKEENNTYLSFNAVIGTSLEVEQCIAFQVIESAILSSPGAPLKQALIEAGIGSDILSSFDNEILQPNFSIIAKGANKDQKNDFINIIQETLQKIVKEGINENSLRAAINVLEFRYREADFGQFPKGLLLGIQIMGSWLYDDSKAFAYMHGNEIFKQLKAKIGTGYYEELIDRYLLHSNHVTHFTLSPKNGLNREKEEALAKKLAAYKESLSEDEIDALITSTKHLQEYQETPSTKEELLKIPMLKREDISKEAPALYNEEKEIAGVPVLHHEVFTNGIAYIKCLFDISDIDEELLPYMNLLAAVLGYIDTKNYSFLELSNEINMHTGDMRTDFTVFNKKNDPEYYRPVFYFSTKLLYDEMAKAFELMREIIFESKLTDSKRLLEILKEIKSRLQMKMNSSGHNVAVDRALSYISQSGYYSDLTKGVRFYRFVTDLVDNFDEKKEQFSQNLSKLTKMIFNEMKLVVSITAEANGYETLKQVLPNFVNALNDGNDSLNPVMNGTKRTVNDVLKPAKYNFPVEKLNEGFTYSGQVQYVATCGNYIKAGFKSSGALKVLKTILGYDYLWNKVRVKGGAYGCMCSFSGIDGTSYIVSYRDPNLKETVEVYKNTKNYIENFEVDDRDMTKYIIGTMSSVDTPLTPMMKGSRSLNAYLCGVSHADIQKDRDDILSTTKEDIRNTAVIIDSVISENNLCVIGNEKKVANHKEMFYNVKPLLN